MKIYGKLTQQPGRQRTYYSYYLHLLFIFISCINPGYNWNARKSFHVDQTAFGYMFNWIAKITRYFIFILKT